MPLSPSAATPFTALPLAMARRLWRAFSTGRVFSALVLLVMLVPQTPHLRFALTFFAWALGCAYLLLAIVGWLLLRDRPPAARWGLPWLVLLASEIGTISLLQLLQLWQPGTVVHFSPLLALPLLASACLGSLRMALATTACATLVLLGGYAMAALEGMPNGWELTMQTALVCAGYFVVVYLTHHLAQRLAWQERLARQNHHMARAQAEINALIIDKLTEGVLVVDASLSIQQANPAALHLLGHTSTDALTLHAKEAWAPLRELVMHCLMNDQAQDARMYLLHAGQAPIGLYVRVWPSNQYPAVPIPTEALDTSDAAEDTQHSPLTTQCLVFLEDLRELEARLRTEKMAAMGRISAAVAHEIRNPLAAITQANALLQEELHEPTQQRLSRMIEQNAQRLAHTVDDVLDIARVQQQIQHNPSVALELDSTLASIWQEWQAQDSSQRLGRFSAQCPGMVAFDGEHLRRVVVNLLDNAQRYAQGEGCARLQLSTRRALDGRAWLQIWSAGPEIEASVQQHLFEPFFSSRSRSSGLGLFICRELCQRHGAHISYQRQACADGASTELGNAFIVHFAHHLDTSPGSTANLFDS